MSTTLLLSLGRPPRLLAANPESRHGGLRPPEAYRLRRIWCLNLYRGHGELTWQGRAHAIRPGSFSLTAPDTDHAYRYRGEALLTWFHFLPDLAGDLVEVPLIQDGGARFAGLLAQAQDAARCLGENPVRAQALLWSLLWQAASIPVLSAVILPDAVRRAMTHADGRLGEPLTAGDLARAAGVSVTHLNRLFHGACGCAAMAWVRRRRVERATHLLRCSTLSASRIAFELGFVDLQHFNKTLHRATGSGPRALRAADGGETPDLDGAGVSQLKDL